MITPERRRQLIQTFLNEVKKEEFVPQFCHNLKYNKNVVYYGGPLYDDEELIEVIDTFLFGKWLASGDKVAKFEREFSKIINVKHSLMVNSGSSANLVMLSAFKKFYKLKNDDEVIVSVVGFPTTLAPIIQCGFKPVFVDIEFDTLNFNLMEIVKVITSKTKAIVLSPVLGNPPDIDLLIDICKKHNIHLLVDGCDSLGSKWDGKNLSEFGEISTCSFYPAHHACCGQGGMVSSNKEELIKLSKSISAWGRSCFIKGTPINVGEKIKNIEDIIIGDEVLTHNGNIKKVNEVFKKDFSGNYITLNCRLKNKVSSTDYHPHLVLIRKNRKQKIGEIKWVLAKDIKIGDCLLERIPKECILDEHFEWSYELYNGIKKERLKADPDLMRLIGYWLAEGCVDKSLKGKSKIYKENKYFGYTVTFHFNKEEIEYINDVVFLMKKYFGVTGYPGRKYFKTNGRSICFKSRKAYEFFIQHFNKLSYNKSLPKNMVNWKNELTSELVKGIWRGDGSKSSNQYSIDMTSFELIEQIRRILLKHKILCSFYKTEKEKRQKNQILNNKVINAKHDIFHVCVYGKNAENFSNEIVGENMISKTNKRFAFISGDELYACYPVYKIESKYIEETVYNIEVEGDHSYHAYGVITHNCYCVGVDNLLPNGTCNCRFSKWIKELPYPIDHKYFYTNVGYNLQPLDIQGALGLAQLKKLDYIHEKRKLYKDEIQTIFSNIKGLIFPTTYPKSDVSWFGVPIICNTVETKTRLVKYLEDNKIQTRNYFAGNILVHDGYKEFGNWKDYPMANQVLERVFFVGCSPTMSQDNIEYIREVIKKYEN